MQRNGISSDVSMQRQHASSASLPHWSAEFRERRLQTLGAKFSTLVPLPRSTVAAISWVVLIMLTLCTDRGQNEDSSEGVGGCPGWVHRQRTGRSGIRQSVIRSRYFSRPAPYRPAVPNSSP
jgi:hypothetical protein